MERTPPDMLKLAIYASCGAVVCYLFGRNMKGASSKLKSIIRVKDINCLDDLVKEKTSNFLVVVSGRVGSASPLNCKQNGLLAVFIEEEANVDIAININDGGGGGQVIEKSLKFLLQKKEVPLFLEDSTGQVDVVGAQFAEGFSATLNKYVFNMPPNELFSKLVQTEGLKVIKQSCQERALHIGKVLTFVGEAVRDKAGNIVIRRPNGLQSFRVFNGELSFDKAVYRIKSKSELLFDCSMFFGCIAVASTIGYVLGKIFFPLRDDAMAEANRKLQERLNAAKKGNVAEKPDLRNRSECDVSDTVETSKGEASDAQVAKSSLTDQGMLFQSGRIRRISSFS